MYDYVIIGGGIIGLSTAWQLKTRCPDKRILLLEKEARYAAHQTGRNSGVIHAGIYYAPGSMKAKFCKLGVDATLEFCKANGVAFEQCGKLLVATNEVEQQRMLSLYERAKQNGLDVEVLDAEELRRREPNIDGCGAIFLRTTGIVGYTDICNALAKQFLASGGEARTGIEVRKITESEDDILLRLADGDIVRSRFVIACAGLMADRVARMQGLKTDFRVIPFRGEYFRLPEHKNGIIRHLIYPIPDPDLPFLGVHLTRMIDGSVTIGPNAVLGWKREGYGRLNFNIRDVFEMITFPGFWRLLSKNLKTGFREFRNSLYKRGYLRLAQKYCPSLTIDDLGPHPTGVRATVVRKDGSFVDDFLFLESRRSLHVCSAPSPAATSAIPIGAHICDQVTAARHDQAGAT